jgi:hypothetical protein
MGFLGIPFDMMTSVLIPMLMGLTVDDTIHFINHAKYEYQKRREYAVAYAKQAWYFWQGESPRRIRLSQPSVLSVARVSVTMRVKCTQSTMRAVRRAVTL